MDPYQISTTFVVGDAVEDHGASGGRCCEADAEEAWGSEGRKRSKKSL